ncbi:bifunctional riboflavin kinase/FAD synthetase [Parvularcula sp. LCG005]|uniref:bifunctional riboflavin kinase/FAD synthetase n=1 Tax=Parvularcula sp. LCG005 TaxID=3078805 RepID=UPI002941BAA8|nr:bifunctional riboflavin kinase/FAD synthetase [Parvularcula sp. LCG005]WOI52808.1 bifunctional riboflavin kinase/FAD synthetase [Parvularcula sp. LCG005]
MSTPTVIRAPLHCDVAPALRDRLAVIGNMDGVHLGHQVLLDETVRLAGERPTAAIVFEPHPRRVFAPESAPFLLTDLTTKTEIISAHGIDTIFVLPFIDDLYRQTPEKFVQQTLGQRLGLAGIVTGSDFQFGKGRAGDVYALKGLAEQMGMEAHAITPILKDGGDKYSSSAIRQALREGRPEDAAQQLGRPFGIRGDVIEGRKLARNLGVPTANVALADYVRPLFGVYAINVDIGDRHVPGIANVGIRPTVDGTAPLLEAHLFDFDGDLYGQTIRVDLLHFIRPEQKFDGLDALKAQISKDSGIARDWLSENLGL